MTEITNDIPEEPSDDQSETNGGNGDAEARKPEDAAKCCAHPAWDFAARVFPWVLGLVVFLYFLPQLKSVAKDVAERVKNGAPIKFKDVEIGAVKVEPGEGTGLVQGVRRDNGSREKERNNYYSQSRRIMLVHTIARSSERSGWYDIRIFVIPHNRVEDSPEEMVTLASVERVEYYFGEAWGKRIFTVQDRTNNFALKTSAYGPFLATAKVFFNDGQSTVVYRYIDFEMGSFAPISAPETEAAKPK